MLTTPRGPNLFCCFAVDDVPAAIETVLAAGGDASEPRRESYGVVAACTDDQGNQFAIYQEPGGPVGLRPPADSVRPGDLSYLVLEVVDSQRAAAVPMWQVDDIVRAVEAVRAGGGQGTDPERQPYGVSSSCADDQGMRFYLGQT